MLQASNIGAAPIELAPGSGGGLGNHGGGDGALCGNGGYTFDPNVVATRNGMTATVANNTGTTVTLVAPFSLGFPAVPVPALDKLALALARCGFSSPSSRSSRPRGAIGLFRKEMEQNREFA